MGPQTLIPEPKMPPQQGAQRHALQPVLYTIAPAVTSRPFTKLKAMQCAACWPGLLEAAVRICIRVCTWRDMQGQASHLDIEREVAHKG